MPNLATWFTPSLQTISRSAGRSSVIAAAYRACVKLTDERLGITRDFTPKGKHGLAGNICIGIPNDDIEKLWNNAEKSETRANSTVARELMIPLSSEWSDDERSECVRAIAQMLRDEYGVAVLASIHRPAIDNNNDHAHILFTTRTVDAEGIFGKKTRILDDAKTGEVKKMREAVCAIVNKHALANGNDWYVYAGKFSDIIEDHLPTKHISITAGKSQKSRIDANRQEVNEARIAIANTQKEITAIDAKIKALQTQSVLAESSQKAAPMPDKSAKGVTVEPTRAQVLERLRGYPELMEYLDEAKNNEALFETLLEMESDIKYGATKPKEEPPSNASTDYLKSVFEAEESEKNRLAHVNAAIKKALADITYVPLDETKTQKAMRLHSVWATYEQHEQRMRTCHDAMAHQRRILEELRENPPSFWQSAAKKEHKQQLYCAHANLLGLAVVYDQSKAYRANKQIRDMQAAFCANLEYRQIVQDCAAQVPVFSGLSKTVSEVLTNNPALKKEAWAKCDEALQI